MDKRIHTIGSFNKHKMEMMYPEKKVYECHISEFKGNQLSYEYID